MLGTGREQGKSGTSKGEKLEVEGKKGVKKNAEIAGIQIGAYQGVPEWLGLQMDFLFNSGNFFDAECKK